MCGTGLVPTVRLREEAYPGTDRWKCLFLFGNHPLRELWYHNLWSLRKIVSEMSSRDNDWMFIILFSQSGLADMVTTASNPDVRTLQMSLLITAGGWRLEASAMVSFPILNAIAIYSLKDKCCTKLWGFLDLLSAVMNFWGIQVSQVQGHIECLHIKKAVQ